MVSCPPLTGLPAVVVAGAVADGADVPSPPPTDEVPPAGPHAPASIARARTTGPRAPSFMFIDWGLLSSDPQPRIERVTQRVAKHGERKDGQEDGQSRPEGQPGRLAQRARRGADHRPP